MLEYTIKQLTALLSNPVVADTLCPDVRRALAAERERLIANRVSQELGQ